MLSASHSHENNSMNMSATLIMKGIPTLASSLLCATSFVLASLTTASAGEINGFDTSSDVLDETTLIRVGPVDSPMVPLDEIKLEAVADTDWNDDDFVMGVALNGEARAYPLAMMVWHQVVNDELGEVPILVTFCRLCGTGVVYDRWVGDQTLSFGMSGLIYRADILLYDRETRSLWSRFLDESVAGDSAGLPIFGMPHQIATVGEWKAQFPESSIVSRDNSYGVDYDVAPMGGATAGQGVFATLPKELRYHPAMPVVGVRQAGKTKAYPAGEILANGGMIQDDFDGVAVDLTYTAKDQAFNHGFEGTADYDVTTWANWTAKNPETDVFKSGEAQ